MSTVRYPQLARWSAMWLMVLATVARAVAQPPGSLAIERIAAERDRGSFVGQHYRWSPDGKRIGFIRAIADAGKTVRGPVTTSLTIPELWTIDSASGKESALVSISELQTALGDRKRRSLVAEEQDESIRRSYLKNFQWSPDSRAVLLANATSLAWFDLNAMTARTLVAGDSELSDAQISPNGRFVSFIRERGLWIADVAGGTLRAIAEPAAADMYEGQPDWVYSHEFGLDSAYAWSPDSGSIAWLEMDDRAVDKYALRSADGSERLLDYPKPGGAIPVVRVLVRKLSENKPLTIELGSDTDVYTPRLAWLPDGKHLSVERLSRSQKTVDLRLADAATGKSIELLTEKDSYWINIGEGPRWLSDSRRFLWTSERSGYRHLYLYDVSGRQLAQLTHGDWEVTSLAGVDEALGAAYVTGTEASPLERQLYRVPLDGGAPARVTREKGTHDILMQLNGASILDTWSSRASPPRRFLLRGDGSAIAVAPPTLPATLVDDAAASRLPQTEFLTVKSHMGLDLRASITRPPDFHPEHRYPAIYLVGGGPGAQMVKDAWGGDVALWLSSMAQSGYVVFALDARGSAGRGHLFEEALHLRFSASEMADVRDGVLYLHSQPWVDTARIGICGWDFGGFLALHGMLDRPILFKAGFAGSPIADWHLYDAAFAERYLESPVKNQDGWLASSPLDNAGNLSGPLLLAQGTLDETIHTENALMLLDELLDRGKYADILLFADRDGVFADRSSRRILFQRISDFFLKNL